MPDSQSRRRGRPRQSHRRRGGAVTPPRASRVGDRTPGSAGRFGIRPRTWRKIRRWAFVSVAGLFAAAIIGSFAASSFGRTTGGGGASSPTEGVGTPVDLTGAGHVPVGTFVSYSTTPPTSGPHWPSPAECGIYDAAVADEHVVHNMEHGHVIISYNLPDPEEAASMRALADSLSALETWGIVRPYSKIDQGTVAMTAWGVIDEVQGVDEDRIRTFYEAYARNRFSEESARVGSIPCTSSV